MASPYVELVVQSMKWVNILMSLGIIIISFNPSISKFFRQSRNMVYLLLLWAAMFLSVPFFVPSIYQYELFLEILQNYAAAALPLGPIVLLIINRNMSKTNNHTSTKPENKTI